MAEATTTAPARELSSERMERGASLLEVEDVEATDSAPAAPARWCGTRGRVCALVVVVLALATTGVVLATTGVADPFRKHQPHHGPGPAPGPPVPKGKECSLALSTNCATCEKEKDGGNEVCTSCHAHEAETGADLKLDRGRCTMVCQGLVGCKSCRRSPDGTKVACEACAQDYYPDPTDASRCVAFDQVPGSKLLKFYSYRATDAESYPFGNCDGASALGVLGYLLHEVVGWVNGTTQTPMRKFGIDRIKRELIFVRNPPAVYLTKRGQVNPQFGPWNPFDKAMCSTTANPPDQDEGCVQRWQAYGFNVGCQKQWCPACSNTIHRESSYYDFPAACPEKDYKSKTPQCSAKSPGGQCARPNGRRDCTWNATEAGEILLDELEGISETVWKDFKGFAAAKQCEFDRAPPGGCAAQGLKGNGLPYWGAANLMDDPIVAQARLQKLEQMFREKFPQFEELQEPPCDW